MSLPSYAEAMNSKGNIQIMLEENFIAFNIALKCWATSWNSEVFGLPK